MKSTTSLDFTSLAMNCSMAMDFVRFPALSRDAAAAPGFDGSAHI
jgi:hypothetical protein